MFKQFKLSQLIHRYWGKLQRKKKLVARPLRPNPPLHLSGRATKKNFFCGFAKQPRRFKSYLKKFRQKKHFLSISGNQWTKVIKMALTIALDMLRNQVRRRLWLNIYHILLMDHIFINLFLYVTCFFYIWYGWFITYGQKPRWDKSWSGVVPYRASPVWEERILMLLVAITYEIRMVDEVGRKSHYISYLLASHSLVHVSENIYIFSLQI